MATTRTVFIDSALSDSTTLAAQYDANVFNVVMLDGATPGPQQIQDWVSAHGVSTAEINVVSASASLNGLFTPRVVFVDPSVADYQSIIAATPANATIVVLDAGKDGVQQIHDFLAHNTGLVAAIDIVTNLASVDVVSHGSPGEIHLGSTVLNADNMAAYSATLADIGSHLTAGADILLYGCDVAAGATGQQFIASLAAATGADVAASTDLTGAAAAGGDWVLEASTGTIETAAITDAAYTGTLDAATAVTAFTMSADSGTSATDFVTNVASQTISGSFTASTNNSQMPTVFVSTDGTGATRTGATVTYTDNAGSGTFTATVTLAAGAGKSIQFWGAASGSNSLGSTHTYTLDTAGPATTVNTVGFSNDSGGSASDFNTNVASQTISGTLSANTASGEVVKVSLDNGASWQTASNTIGSNSFSLSGVTLTGNNTLKVQVEDAAGNAGTARTQAYVLDTTAPAAGTLAFTSLADSGTAGDGITNDNSFGLSLTGNEAGAGVVYQVSTDNGAHWSSTGTTQTALTDGSYQFRAQVTDTAGNSATAAAISVTIDTAAPGAPVITGFATNSGSLADTISNDNTPTLTVTAEADATVGIYQGGVLVGTATQTSPHSGIYTYTSATLADGSYNFTAKASDAAGNTSAASAAQQIKVDTTADAGADLAVHVSDSLVNNAEKGAVAFTVSGLDADATATTTFSDGSHTVTASGTSGTVNLSTLNDGDVTVTVTATDTADNHATGAGASTTLDTTADVGADLAVHLASTLVGNAGKGAVAYTVAGLDADATATVTFSDGSHSVTGSAGHADLSTLNDGAITVTVAATDTAGNHANGASAATTLDTIADAGGDLAVHLSDSLVNNAEKGAVAYTVSGLDADATATVTFSDGTHSVTGSNGSADLSALTDGAITVTVAATDAAGNHAGGAGAATTLDTTADAGADLAIHVSDNLVNNAEKGAVAYTISGLDADATATVTFTDGSHSVAGSNGSADLSTLTDGAITATIAATDTAGNHASGTGAATTLDTTADAGADLAIHVSDSLVNNAEKGTVAYTISGLDADATATVTFSDGVHSATGNNGSANLSALTDGAITVTIAATDAAGNHASGAGTATTLDTTADAGADLAVHVSDSLVNNAEKGGVAYTVSGLDADATATVTFSDGTHSVTGSDGSADLSTLTDGAITVTVAATDAAGNHANGAGVTTTLDTTADAGSNLAVHLSDSLVNNGEKGSVAYTVSGLDADATATVTFSDGTHNVAGNNGAADLSAFIDGPVTVTIAATDAAGNHANGAGAATTLDTTADAGADLAIHVSDSLVNNAEKGAVAYTVSGLDDDATATVTFSDGVHSVTGSDGSADLSTLTDGAITVTVAATDAAGNHANGAGAATTLDTTADAGANLAVHVSDSLVNNAEQGSVAYTVSGLDADATATVTFTDGTNSVTGTGGSADLSTLADGAITVTIAATDTAGNHASGAGAATTLDTTADAGADLAVHLSDSLVNNAEKGAVAYTVSGLDDDATATVTFSDGSHSVAGSNGSANLSALTDGAITVTVAATDAAGNHAGGAGAATTLDTTADAGADLAVHLSDSLVNNAEKGSVAYTVSGLDTDATAVVTFTDGTNSVTGTDGSADLSTLTDGAITVTVAATDAAGNHASGAGATTTLDTTADAGSNLAVHVSDSLVNNAEKGSVAYTVSGLDADATAIVTFSDGTHSVTGTGSSADLSTLTDGAITVTVAATDTAGNHANGAGAATTLDTTADAGADLAVHLSDSLVNNAEKGAVAYTVSGLDDDATATVTFSDGVHSVTGSDGTADLSTLTDGAITVTVAATDAAGNHANGAGAATTLDTTADAGADLAVHLSDSLVNNAEKGSVAYTVSGLDADATAVVTFTDGTNSVTGTDGSADLSTLSDGAITVTVAAADAAGNHASGAGATTTLDTTADAGSNLAVHVSDSLVNNAEKGSVAYTVSGLDADATAIVTFSDGVHSATGSNGSADLSALTDGAITVTVAATDAAGNHANGAGAATTLDTTADAGGDLAIHVSDSLVNNAEKGAVAYTVSGLDDDATATVTFSDGVHSVTGSDGSADLSTLTDGAITVTVAATDAAGNHANGAGAATTLDTTADAGANLAVHVSDSLVNNAEKGSVAYTISGLDTDATAVVTFTDGTNSVIGSGTGSGGSADLSTLTDGAITVTIAASDTAGNHANGAGTATTLDTTADAGADLTVHLSDSLVNNAEKGAVAYTVSGLDDDATATVTFSDGVHSVTGSDGTADLSTLTDGAITVTVAATDAAGNHANGAGAATTLDTTADAGADLAVHLSDSLVNNAEKGSVAYTVSGLDADATATVTFSDGVHSITGSDGSADLSTLIDGAITVTVAATDAAGNHANGAGVTTTLDTTADAGSNLAVHVSDSLVNNAEKGSVAYTVSGLDADATATVTFSDGSHSVAGSNGSANLSALTDGAITVTVAATDTAGNHASGAGAATTLDTTADAGADLAVHLSDSLVNNAEKGAVAYTVSGLDDDATATVTFSDGVHSVTGSDGTANLSTLTDGAITVTVAATDAAGNHANGAGAATTLDTTADAGADLAVHLSDSLVNNAEKGSVAYTVSGLDADATAVVTFTDGTNSVTGTDGSADLSTLADGAITVTIAATDTAGNHASGAGAATTLDTTADAGADLAIHVSDSLVNNAEKGTVAYTVSGLDDDATATVTFSDGVHSATGSNGSADLSALTDGAITVTVAATDAAGNHANGAGAATTLDTTADAGADLAIHVSNSLVNNAEKGAVAYTVSGLDDDATATVTFSDGVHSVTGSDGSADLSTLTDGAITVTVAATDAAGNHANGAGAITALDTSADVGANLAVHVSDSLVNNAEKGSVAYTISGLDTDATAVVTFTDGTNSVIGSGTGSGGSADLSTLTDGAITVTIAASDTAGNHANGAGTATTLDTTADAGTDLAVHVSDTLVSNAEKGTVAYTVSGLDDDATATVTFSDGVHSVTGSDGTANLSTLTDGAITVTVAATDAAGNHANGAGAATTLDTTADAGADLAVHLSDSLVNNAEKGSVAYTVSGLDADATAVVTFTDGTNSVTGTDGSADLSTLTDGAITVTVAATDAAGNHASGAGAATTLDTTADAGTDLAVHVSDTLVSNAEKGAVAYTVTGLDADATAVVTFSDGTHSVTGNNGSANLSSLTDGAITVTIAATDAAGNHANGTGAATTLDTTADAGADLAVHLSDSLVNNAEKGALAYTVSGLDADAAADVTFSDGSHSVTGNNGAADLSALTDGAITVTIVATDAAGNHANGTGAATTLDTTADAGADLAVHVSDSLVNNAEKGAVAYTVAGLDADASAVVTFSDGTHSVTGSNGSADLSSLTDGAITVTIAATDAAGNHANGASATTTLDTTADASADLAVHVSDSLVGNAEKGAVAYTVSGLDADATATVTFSDGVHSATGSNGSANLSALTDGAITVTIAATDAAGNHANGAGTATTLDTTADAGADLAVHVSDSLLNNAEKGAVTYTVSGLDADATAVVTFSDGTHSVTGTNGSANLSSLTDGAITVAIAATDAAGNHASGAGAATTLDTTADVSGNLAVHLSDSLVNNAEKGTVAYTIAGLDPDATASVTFSDGSHSVTGSNSSADLSSLTDGAITVTIAATDTAGNQASGAGATTTLDTTADASADLAVHVSDSVVNNAKKGGVSYTVTGLDADATAIVTFTDGTHSVTGSNGTANLSSLTDGAITATIAATDAAGNHANGASAGFTLDTTADAGANLAVHLPAGLVGNAGKGAVAYTVSGLDGDATAAVTFSDGSHSATGNNGLVDLSALLDGPISVAIAATDAAGNHANGAGAAATLDTTADVGANLAVTVTDQSINNAEKGAVAYTVLGLDADAHATVTFSDGSHSVLGANGIANLSTLTDGPISVTIGAADLAGNTATGTGTSLTLDAHGPVFSSSSTATVAENVGASQVVYTAAASDAHAITYSLLGNNNDDAAAFTIAANGAVTLGANPDFETKSSYHFTVQATDSFGNTSLQAVTLGVTDVNEAPNASPVSLTTIENAVITTSLTNAVSDVDAGDTLTFALSSGTLSLSWSADSTSQSLINPVTHAVVNLATLAAQATLSADGSTLNIATPAELDWMTTGQAIRATLNYTATDHGGLSGTDSIALLINGSTADKGVNLNGGNGNDTLSGNTTNNAEDVLQGANGNDTLSGYGGTDALYGGNGDDKLSGGAGIDYLYGDQGNDTLDGGTENDYLFGGKGNDSLTGGTGADKFVFEPQFGSDRITDFHLAEGDKLYFADILSTPMTADAFVAKYVTDTGNDLLISLPGGSIVLVGVASVSGLAAAISFGMPT
ncbi:Ig-like domain-containing protein [Rugamonas apoptosis]|uniref:DUF4347 domain-containing protein n=1 Tax=Rugamonas apoptosis TaxID=2758570 RepID=A0A7W2F5I1_9BURK|nr:Ig-like domain-containing protein [Rugamonas apoptosis]MBA5685508.1 DUF4347 domain-containing protein [Rugamonas apoptosis]